MSEKKEKYTAVVLAAGKGTRMGGSVAKQFLEIGGKPVVVYALEVFEHSPEIDQIILVTGTDKIEYCQKEIIEKYGIKKTEEKACVLGMPVKDTIKLTDENGKIRESPRRDLVWQAQTPQAFAAELLFPAFEKLMQHSIEGITDDAMVVEQEMGITSVMVKGGYENIKITTPEDLLVAESFLAEK